MEAWREELYHGLFDSIRNRVKKTDTNNSNSGESGKSKTGRTWKKHKYIRIENGRYIYPEDLEKKNKKTTYQNQGVTNATSKANSKTKGKRAKPFRKMAKLKYKYDQNSGSDVYTGLKGKRAFKQAKKVIKLGNKYNNTGNTDSTLSTHHNPITKNNTTYKVSVQYKNGKSFFDRVIVDSNYYKEPAGISDVRNNQVYEDTYTYEYGKLHQAYNKGKEWMKKLG